MNHGLSCSTWIKEFLLDVGKLAHSGNPLTKALIIHNKEFGSVPKLNIPTLALLLMSWLINLNDS